MNQARDLSDFTFVSKYAKYIKEKKRRETWDECVNRMESMHLDKYKNLGIDDSIREVLEAVRQKKILGSQRALQFSGPAVSKHNARIYNCAGSYCDRLRFFQECMYLLLCGTGTGFSVQRHHIDKLPKLSQTPKIVQKIYTIEDSIEGWADALGVLLSSYFENPIYPEFKDCEVIFDYNMIRPEGSEFSHGIGKAPGPNGLRNALEKIRGLLTQCVAERLEKIRPIHAYDIVMLAADAVLSGGIRRSATICLFSFDDEEMATSKVGKWFETHPHRGRSNNSAVLLRNVITKEQFDKFKQWTKQGGEPGFIWVDNLEFIFNPCVEIIFYCYDEFGNSGWQMCNLSTINCSKIKTVKDFIYYSSLASILGTMQAGYDSFPYLGEVTERIVKKEALIGVSMTGMMVKPDIMFNAEYQRNAAETVKKYNKEFAEKIKINQAARTTCVKPEGSSTTVLGLVAFSGCHAGKGKKVLRRIQMNKLEEPLQYYKKLNPKAVEDSVWSPNKTDEVVTFCCEAPEGSIQENDMGPITFLELVRLTQNNWVKTGCNPELCSRPGMQHNVSNTVRVGINEWDSVWDYIYQHRQDFSGISFISKTGDKDYEQAPFTEIFTPAEILEKYGNGALFTSGLIDFANHDCGGLWKACNALKFDISKDDKLKEEKEEFVRKSKNFAKKYLSNDLSKLECLLKDVYNWKQWLDIISTHKNVDYSNLEELINSTTGTQEVACSGGVCQI